MNSSSSIKNVSYDRNESRLTMYKIQNDTISSVWESVLGSFFSQNLMEKPMVFDIACLVICIIAFISCFMIAILLMRKSPRNAHNLLLGALACFNMVTFLSQTGILIQVLIHMYVITSPSWFNGWTGVMDTVNHISLTAHTISSYISVTLVIIRFFQVRKSAERSSPQKWMKAAKISLTVVSLSCIAVIPISHLCLQDDWLIKDPAYRRIISFLIYPVFTNILPCLLMLIFGAAISCIITFRLSNRRMSSIIRRQRQKQMKSSRMQLLIVFLFLASELPSAIISLLGLTDPYASDELYFSSNVEASFVTMCLTPFILILYCFMSHSFRNDFKSFYLRRLSCYTS